MKIFNNPVVAHPSQVTNVQKNQDTQQTSGAAGLLNRFKANLPHIRRQQGRQEVPRTDLAAVKAGSASPLRTSVPKALGAGTVSIPVPPDNVHQRVDVSSLPKGELRRVAGQVREQMGKGWEKSDAGKQLFSELAGKALAENVRRGSEVYQSIIEGGDTAATDSNIKDLLSFLHAQGQAKAGATASSTLIIEDPNHQLKDFLDSSVKGYARTSSYAKESQAEHGHRGIDVSLPGGKGSLLYGALHDSTGAVGDRLLLKMESNGAALSKLFNRNVSGEPTSRTLKFADIGKLIKRGWSKVFHSGTTETKRATLPKELRNDFQQLGMKALKYSPHLWRAITEENPARGETSVGISRMYQNCKAALEGIASDARMEMGAPMKADIEAFMQKLSSQYDNLDIRLGDEVALSSAELKPFVGLTGNNTGEIGNSLAQQLNELAAKGTVTTHDVTSFMKLITVMEASVVIRPDDTGAADTFDRMRDVISARLNSFAKDNGISPEALKAGFGKLLQSDSMKAFMGDLKTSLDNMDAASNGVAFRLSAVAESLGFSPEDIFVGATGDFPNFDKQISVIDTLKSEMGAKFMMRELPLELLGANGVGNMQKLSGNEFATVTDEEHGVILHRAGRNAAELVGKNTLSQGEYNIQAEVENALTEDLQTTPAELWEPKGVTGEDLAGVSLGFIKDFIRDGIKIDAKKYQPASNSDEDVAAAYRKVIKMLDGPERARKITRVAFQNVHGIAQSSWVGVDKPLSDVYMDMLQRADRPVAGLISISTQGDKYGITASMDQQTDDLSMVLTTRFRVSFAGEAEHNPVIERVTAEAALVDRPL